MFINSNRIKSGGI